MPLNQRLIVALQHYILHCTKSNIFLNLSLIRLVTRFVGEKSLATAEEEHFRGYGSNPTLGAYPAIPASGIFKLISGFLCLWLGFGFCFLNRDCFCFVFHCFL